MTPCNIACDLHDYIEIACLYRYRVQLHMDDGDIVEGLAGDIATRDKREYLLLDNDREIGVELANIAKMQVLTPNAKFDTINFK
ncbi:MAG: Rho-binding antiterminator [Gammaproteobacteria bacterium]